MMKTVNKVHVDYISYPQQSKRDVIFSIYLVPELFSTHKHCIYVFLKVKMCWQSILEERILVLHSFLYFITLYFI